MGPRLLSCQPVPCHGDALDFLKQVFYFPLVEQEVAGACVRRRRRRLQRGTRGRWSLHPVLGLRRLEEEGRRPLHPAAAPAHQEGSHPPAKTGHLQAGKQQKFSVGHYIEMAWSGCVCMSARREEKIASHWCHEINWAEIAMLLETEGIVLCVILLITSADV